METPFTTYLRDAIPLLATSGLSQNHVAMIALFEAWRRGEPTDKLVARCCNALGVMNQIAAMEGEAQGAA